MSPRAVILLSLAAALVGWYSALLVMWFLERRAALKKNDTRRRDPVSLAPDVPAVRASTPPSGARRPGSFGRGVTPGEIRRIREEVARDYARLAHPSSPISRHVAPDHVLLVQEPFKSCGRKGCFVCDPEDVA